MYPMTIFHASKVIDFGILCFE